MNKNYSALTLEELPKRLSQISAITDQIGTNFSEWNVTEVGDGNLNLVFIVIGSKGKIVIKQALPYVRVVGDSWPLTLERAYLMSLNGVIVERPQHMFMRVAVALHGDDLLAVKQTYDLIGWQNTDMYQNFNITFLSSIRKNRVLPKNLFKIPAQN